MISGDGNADGQLSNIDIASVWKPNTGKSSQVPGEWVCGFPLTDIHDGQLYNTVQIGTQCWMAQNLNIGAMITGTTVMTNSSILEKYCYNDDPSFCNEYGALYQWNEAMEYSTLAGSQGICPA